MGWSNNHSGICCAQHKKKNFLNIKDCWLNRTYLLEITYENTNQQINVSDRLLIFQFPIVSHDMCLSLIDWLKPSLIFFHKPLLYFNQIYIHFPKFALKKEEFQHINNKYSYSEGKEWFLIELWKIREWPFVESKALGLFRVSRLINRIKNYKSELSFIMKIYKIKVVHFIIHYFRWIIL